MDGLVKAKIPVGTSDGLGDGDGRIGSLCVGTLYLGCLGISNLSLGIDILVGWIWIDCWDGLGSCLGNGIGNGSWEFRSSVYVVQVKHFWHRGFLSWWYLRLWTR